MYKVFVNRNSRLVIRGVAGETDAGCGLVLRYEGAAQIEEALHRCRTAPVTVCLLARDTDAAWRALTDRFRFIEAAGGLVFDESRRLLMIYRNGMWDLPKGKAEKGEAMPETAVREVCEETGVCDLKIVSPPAITYHTYRLKQKDVLKRTTWYRMVCGRFDGFRLQEKEGIEQAGWYGREEALRLAEGTYPLIRELVEGVAEEM